MPTLPPHNPQRASPGSAPLPVPLSVPSMEPPIGRPSPGLAAMTSLAAATLLGALGISMATVALPTLIQTFDASVAAVQWVVLAYLLTVTVTVVTAGRLGDVLGHRRTLMAGLAVFALASLLAALAQHLALLVAARVVQGLGGAVLMALPLSLARELVTRERIGSAMGTLAMMSAIGTALGPSLGGLLIAGFGWRMAFAALGLAAALAGLLAWASLPPARRSDRGGKLHLDGPGMGWLSVTLLLYALATMGNRAGVALPSGWLLALAGLGLAGFVRCELRAAAPLVPMGLLRDGGIGVPLTINLLVGAVMMSTLVVGPLYLSFGLGLDAAGTGLVMAVGPAVAAVSGVPAGWLSDRFGTRTIQRAGLTQAMVGLLCLACLPRFWGVPGYVVALALSTPGFQLFLAANNAGVMLRAADAQRGLVSGLLGLSRNLGFVTGASLLSALFTAVLGPAALLAASAQAVGQAFTVTFVVAAGFCAVGLLLAILTDRRSRRR